MMQLQMLSLMDDTQEKVKKSGKEKLPDDFHGKAMCHVVSDHLQNKSAGFIFKLMCPVFAQGGAETSCKISLFWNPEDLGKMGSTFLSQKEAVVSLPLIGHRSRELDWAPGREKEAPGEPPGTNC